jgi:hypothetical protein
MIMSEKKAKPVKKPKPKKDAKAPEWRMAQSRSNIHSTAYQNGDLHIKFKNGTSYRYENVPPHVYSDLLTADLHDDKSMGSTFHKRVRGGYNHFKMD